MNTRSIRLAKDFITEQGGETAPLPLSEEEIDPSVQYDQEVTAKLLESKEEVYPVDYDHPEDAGCSEFSFFEDGKQRTVQIGHIRAEIGSAHITIPVHYFVVAAVILQRSGRKLNPWREPAMYEGILIERSLAKSKRILSEFEEKGLAIEGVEVKGGDYYDLRRKALQKVKQLRLDLEQDLITKWRKSEESEGNFLVVDGTLMNLRNERNVDRCVGVSKSFQTRYSNASDYSRITSLEEFERSWSFSFHDPEDEDYDLRTGPRERVSWYLRLRTGRNKNPEFGLVRAEISKKYRDEPAKYADQFSRWLLSERLPTSHPAPRWSNHLFPISECENYLTSRMPSTSTINASMKG